jgi:hypothetical protein
VSAGFDRALIERGWLAGGNGRMLLFGASVGGWRALAFASRNPHGTHAKLVEAYCALRFVENDDPATISESFRRLLREVFADDDLVQALSHDCFDLAITTARMRGVRGRSDLRWTLLAAALLNLASSRAIGKFFERVIFVSSSSVDSLGSPSLVGGLQGRRYALTIENVRDVALATGTVPVYMAPVHNIAGTPGGLYLDGALCDYHWNQNLEIRDGVAILFLHQGRIIPGWLDKHVLWRRASGRSVSDVLLVYPDREFVRSLPGGRLPSRDDFFRYVHEPERRIAMWRDVVARSAALGARFLEDATSGAIASRVQPL